MAEVLVRVLVVDDEPEVRSLLAEMIRRSGLHVDEADSVDSAIASLAASAYDLVLTDIRMPKKSGLDLVREARPIHPDLCILLMSGAADLETVVEGMRLGATDFVQKPAAKLELALAIERALESRRLHAENRDYRRNLEAKVKEQTAALSDALVAKEAAWEAALQALVDALDAREQETERHSLRVMRFTEMVARAHGVDAAEIPDISRGALLHDIGKIGIPDAILLKPAGLTEVEWVVMKAHAEIGWQILKGIEYLHTAAEMVFAHQERWDGEGYPRRLKGEQIPLGARLFAIVDAFDAIVSDRPYRKGRSVEWAREEIKRCAGTQFDPKGVETFLSIPAEEWARARQELEASERTRRAAKGLPAVPPPPKELRPA